MASHGFVLFVLAVHFSSCSLKSVAMPTEGMKPTIGTGERVTVNLHAYDRKNPELGDIVVFTLFGQPGRRWVFRVSALPGDTLRYQNGALTRNGQRVTSPAFVDSRSYPPVGPASAALWEGSLRLNSDEYFLLSDDPAYQNDGRVWGPVRRGRILGKVTNHR